MLAVFSIMDPKQLARSEFTVPITVQKIYIPNVTLILIKIDQCHIEKKKYKKKHDARSNRTKYLEFERTFKNETINENIVSYRFNLAMDAYTSPSTARNCLSKTMKCS